MRPMHVVVALGPSHLERNFSFEHASHQLLHYDASQINNALTYPTPRSSLACAIDFVHVSKLRMSVRGPRGGRVRVRGSGRGRGRGRGRKTIWEWESYTPGPEIYDQLWHIRKAPVVVTPQLSTDCPIPNARSRIIDRRQTEDCVQRNFYVVEVAHLDSRDSNGVDKRHEEKEILHVDLSVILDHVSADELERFENEQFKIEAEAEAIAIRDEAEERARRKLEKNTRVPGAGKGSRMLSGLGPDTEVRLRGRPRGRGRGKSRGRASWHRKPTLGREEETQEGIVRSEDEERMHPDGEDNLQRIMAETESEQDEHQNASQLSTSPGLMRSAFVANSALPVPPVAVDLIPPHNYFDTEIEESEIELVDVDTASVSSAARQLHLEDHRRTQSETPDVGQVAQDQHRDKRQRTESTTSDLHTSKPRTRPHFQSSALSRTHSHEAVIPSSTADEMSDSSEASVPAYPPAPLDSHPLWQSGNDIDLTTMQISPKSESANLATTFNSDHVESSSEDQDADAEEYVVEEILEHYFKKGKKYYLVKWAGYEDSNDWLSEEALEGAAELVADYNARIRKMKGKERAK